MIDKAFYQKVNIKCTNLYPLAPSRPRISLDVQVFPVTDVFTGLMYAGPGPVDIAAHFGLPSPVSTPGGSATPNKQHSEYR